MQIAKRCSSLRQCHTFQNALYNKYHSVRLVRAPMFSEEGQYVWEVSGAPMPKPHRHSRARSR